MIGYEGCNLLDRDEPCELATNLKERRNVWNAAYAQVENIEGLIDHSPRPRTWCLYESGVSREPLSGKVSPFAILSRGDWSITSAEAVYADGIAARSTNLTAFVFNDEDSRRKIKILAKVLFGDEVAVGEGLKEAENMKSEDKLAGWEMLILQDAAKYNLRRQIPIRWGKVSLTLPSGAQETLTPTETIAAVQGFNAATDNGGNLKFAGTTQNVRMAMIGVQTALTACKGLKFNDPVQVTIGLHLASIGADGIKAIKYAGPRVTLDGVPGNIGAKMVYESKDHPPAEMKQQAFNEGLLGCLIDWNWIHIEGYDYPDYSCMATVLVDMTAGSGAIKLVNPLDPSDKYTSLLDYVPDGHSPNHRYDPSDVESWQEMVYWGFEWGLIIEDGQKAVTREAVWYATGNLHPKRFWPYWLLYQQKELEGIGSGSSPYFPLASNDLREAIALPGALREDSECKLVYKEKLKVVKEALETVQVDARGRINVGSKNSLADMKWRWIRYRYYEEGTWTEYDDTIRKVTEFGWPVWKLITNGVTAVIRRANWFMRKYSNQASSLGDGLIMKPGMGFLTVAATNVRRNALWELLIEAPGMIAQKPADSTSTTSPTPVAAPPPMTPPGMVGLTPGAQPASPPTGSATSAPAAPTPPA